MPLSKLTINPPPQTSEANSAPTSQIPASASENNSASYSNPGTTSPVAPAYSPITPKVQPTFPATYPLPEQNAALGAYSSLETNGQSPQHGQAIAPPQYIPQPAPQPFSSADSTDAIALRAAISSLQFQKKKAAEDIKALESIRRKALDDPQLFKSELAAGRLNEQKPNVGDLRAILDQEDSDDDDELDEDDEVVLGASAEDGEDAMLQESAEISHSQHTSQQDTSSSAEPISKLDDAAPFDRIPGPQNVVRMPHINWEKYHINGEALDRMHEQQRRWPGSFDYGQDKGREFAVAAPYSPWLDSVDGQQEYRKDSLATPASALTPTVSEHPMETRRSLKNQ